MKKITIIFILLFTNLLLFAQGQIINVPDNFAKIQDAITSSVDGDTIIVAPGRYKENINFNGKNIVLTSYFLFDKDLSFINSTIIDGSNPEYEDSSSVVLFVKGEDSTAVLQGFTITGGKGTRTYNSDENLYFRTGGGILIDHASPTIIFNIITENESINTNGVRGAGGGGMRAGRSKAKISNNIFSYNKGRYAGGVMLAFCEGMTFNNNIIAYNRASNDFNGGGGIYIDWREVPITNCTIVHNRSGGDGGGIIVTGTKNAIKNCIIYDNIASSNSEGKQIFNRFSGNATVLYSNVKGGWAGFGNIDEDPLFIEYSPFILEENSPCIDGGFPNANFNDFEDPDNIGLPLFPALGSLTNDMGTYGGNQLQTMPYINVFDKVKIIQNNSTNKTYFTPGNNTSVVITSQITNPEGQLVNAKAIIKNIDGSVLDSVSMIDDGSLSDSLANDGFYTGTWTIPNNEESYSIDIKVFLTDYKQLISKENALGFTTKGAIKLESFEITSEDSIPNPGDKIELTLKLKNYGITDTVHNVNIAINVLPSSCVKNKTWGGPTFGDIAPGEIQMNTNRPYILEFADTCSSVHGHEFELLIKSNKTVYWRDTLSIDLLTGIEDQKSKNPTEFNLYQNYPNPFNPTTQINFSLPKKSNVKISVYNVIGEKVAELINGNISAGNHKVNFDASNLTSGIYIYKITTEDFASSKKMILLR